MLNFDRTVSESFKAEDRVNDLNYWKKKSPIERLKAAYYLNAVAYQFDPANEPTIDRGCFSARKRD